MDFRKNQQLFVRKHSTQNGSIGKPDSGSHTEPQEEVYSYSEDPSNQTHKPFCLCSIFMSGTPVLISVTLILKIYSMGLK